jgi:hypothetical protein
LLAGTVLGQPVDPVVADTGIELDLARRLPLSPFAVRYVEKGLKTDGLRGRDGSGRGRTLHHGKAGTSQQ